MALFHSQSLCYVINVIVIEICFRPAYSAVCHGSHRGAAGGDPIQPRVHASHW